MVVSSCILRSSKAEVRERKLSHLGCKCPSNCLRIRSTSSGDNGANTSCENFLNATVPLPVKHSTCQEWFQELDDLLMRNRGRLHTDANCSRKSRSTSLYVSSFICKPGDESKQQCKCKIISVPEIIKQTAGSTLGKYWLSHCWTIDVISWQYSRVCCQPFNHSRPFLFGSEGKHSRILAA